MRAFLPSLLAVLLVSTGHASTYGIRQDDVLTISVYGHDELTRDVAVLDDGAFTFPIAGNISAVGKTTDDVAAEVARRLETDMNSPRVTVSVKQSTRQRVYISGSVAKSGSYELKPGWRVSNVIAEAGGLTTRPDLARTTVVRGQNTLDVNLNAVFVNNIRDSDEVLQPDDLVQIAPDTNVVHIIGQARNPGDYQLKNHFGVLEALAVCGGVTERAALSRAQIMRGSVAIPVDIKRAMADASAKENVELKSGDTLIIPANESRIAVLGAVARSGYFDLPDASTVRLADALGLAEGTNRQAKLREVVVVRTVNGQQVLTKLDFQRFLKNGDKTQNPEIQPGDVIYVRGNERIEKGNIISAIATLASPLMYGLVR
ncbi:MAG TPA: SLBB domain-containing protein [Armatimonadota bacterium]|jgi:polysaccharide export outer membrane protein